MRRQVSILLTLLTTLVSALVPLTAAPIFAVNTQDWMVRPGGASRTDGLRTSLGATVREHRLLAGRPEILAVEIIIPALPSGACDLELSALDLDSGRRSAVRKPLVLR